MTATVAIVLAGGRASRMGGVDKPAIVIGGRSMLEVALAAVASCTRIAVVGPHRPELAPEIIQVREVPPGSGPVAAIDAGLRALGPAAPLVVVLAADLPFLSGHAIAELIRHETESGADAVFAADESGRPQYLIGVWRRSALAAALAELDSPINQPMKALVPAHAAIIPLRGVGDCDTEEQLRQAEAAVTASQRISPLDLAEARNILCGNLSRLTAYSADLRSVPGATLADALRASAALPRFDVSAMDGYAVAGEGPWRLRRDIGFAGGRRPVGLLSGEAVRIATGAHVPDGTTRVLRDEFTHRTGETLTCLPDTPPRTDIRRRGEDRHAGDLIAPEGTPVTPALISAAASVEVTTASVRGPVRARIVMTGDEIRGEGPLQEGQTRDSLGPILPTLLSWYGIHTTDRVHLRDTPHGFDEVLAAATDCDLLVIIGATGSGAADQLRAAVHRAQATILVPRLRLRPGGSTIVAELPSGTTVFGLPGNPFATTATLMALAPAIVAGRTGAPLRQPLRGPLRNAAEISGEVPRIVPARATAEGGWIGDPAIRTAHLGGLIDRDGLVIVPPGAADDALVEFLPLHH
ncbi:NTP transferase domain-containing protein [Nocardia sp. 004]|uniref:NTP transferase domain-containing protein n=1 Tax=Nocardia sp. 004 TaxID=3385978 RepID=UPI0039A38FAF